MLNLKTKLKNRFRARRPLTLAKLPFKLAVVVMMLIALPLAAYSVWDAYQHFKLEIANVESNILQEKKLLSRITVENILSDIYFRRVQAEQRLRRTLMERVYEAHAIITRIHRVYSGDLPGHDVRQIAKEALRDIRFSSGQGYYFAADLDGTMELFADQPQLEGKSLVDVYDSEGRHVLQDMINRVRVNGEGFYQYNWTKPKEQGRDWPKISFVKEFEPFNWLVGTGEYLDDVEKDIQQEVLLRAKKVHAGYGNTLMILDSNGRLIADATLFPDDVRAFVEQVDDSGRKPVERAMEYASDDREGTYLRYSQTDLHTGEVLPKILYVRGYKYWGWTVVCEVRLTQIDDATAAKKRQLSYDLGKKLAFLFLMIVLGSTSAFFVGRFYSLKLWKDFNAFSSFFSKSGAGDSSVDTTQITFSEFIDLGVHANCMMEQLVRSEARYRSMFEEAGDGILIRDQQSNYLDANPRLLGMLGYTLDEFKKLKNEDLIHPEDLAAYPVEKVSNRLASGETLIIERRYRRKDGSHFPVQLSVRMVDKVSGIVQSHVRDISERSQAERLLQTRMRLLEYAATHSINELLQKTLDEVGTLTDSPVGFYHFLESDQLTLSLQAWSTRTLNEFCTAQGKDVHYTVADAGVWADCIRQQHPVIHNDYKSLPHRKGMPEGHARVVRELVVPIVRGESIVAILGVGNKPSDYNEKDVELVSYLADVAWEICARKRSEKTLQEQDTRIRAITDSAQDAILMINPKGEVSYWNPAAERILGYRSDEALGRDLHELLTPVRYLEAARTAFSEFARTGQGAAVGKTVELFARKKDGQEIAVALSLSATLLGGIWHGIGILRDISAQKGAEAELRELNRDLEEQTIFANEMASKAEMANTAKSQFLANMSHEIRTPMNGVIGMTELLLGTELNHEQSRYAETVKSSAESLLAIINDILDFSKIEAGRLELEILNFGLRGLLDDFAAMLAVRAHGKGLEFICFAAADVPSRLQGDPGRLRQVLTNLVGNAIKFTSAGEVSVKVTLEHETEQDAVIRFSVRDTGTGIPADKQEMIFQSFTQVDASITRKFGGTGLGLSISKQLVEKMGGCIGVNSVEGNGAEFWFTACFAKQPADSFARRDDPARVDIDGVRILVVDDNATNRDVLMSQMRAWGVRAAEASDGLSALKALHQALDESDPYQIAILDMQMPRMDGETLGKAIRGEDRLKDLRLMMMTSVGLPGDAARMLDIGFSAYLTKPVRQSDLRDGLAAVLDRETVSQGKRQLITRHSVRETRRDNVLVLVVDDNVTNQQVALGMLLKLGIRAEVVADGAEAVRALESIPYDLVFMDVQMPVMNGFEATEKIRSSESLVCNPAVPIIAMTAHAMQEARDKCLEAGMNDYVSKPLSSQALADVISRWLPSFSAGGAGVGATDDPKVQKAGVRSTECPVFDRASLLNRLMGDEELARTVLEGFLEDLPRQINELEGLLVAGDVIDSQNRAHTIKGAAASVGGEALRMTATAMEQMARDGELENMRRLLPELKEREAGLARAMRESIDR